MFFPNDLRCGFRKLKEEGGGNPVFWSPSGAVCCYYFCYARRSDLKISMVGIDKVKVRFHYLALAHVSHFFSHMLQSVHLR